MTWGAYLPGIARTVVNCNQNCNQEPGAGVVRHRRREWGGRRVGVWVAGPAGMAAGPCLWVAALDGPLLVRSAHREAVRG